MLINWIYENVPYHLTDPQDLVKALDFCALADIYRKRISTPSTGRCYVTLLTSCPLV
jgi:hypothetical protein